MATRYRGRSDSAAARSGLDRWIGLFAAATTRAVSDAELYEASVSTYRTHGERVLGGSEPGRRSTFLSMCFRVRRSSPSRAPRRSSDAASRRSTRPYLGWSKQASSGRPPSADAIVPSKQPNSSMPSPTSSDGWPAQPATPGRQPRRGRCRADRGRNELQSYRDRTRRLILRLVPGATPGTVGRRRIARRVAAGRPGRRSDRCVRGDGPLGAQVFRRRTGS